MPAWTSGWSRAADPGHAEGGRESRWPIDQLTWQLLSSSRGARGFLERRSRLDPLLADQAPWGPGRVDTFNPYKLDPDADDAGR